MKRIILIEIVVCINEQFESLDVYVGRASEGRTIENQKKKILQSFENFTTMFKKH